MSNADRSWPLVVAVVVGHNEKHLLGPCFRSMLDAHYAPLRIVYIDNGSADGSLDYVQTEFPDVLAVASGGDLGYCGGNNVGIPLALATGAEFILILNPDTVVLNPDYFSVLVDHMAANPTVGKTGPKVYLHRYGNVQNTVLRWPSIAGTSQSFLRDLLRLRGIPTAAELNEPTEVDSLNGVCVLIRAQALREVGLYDRSFWGWAEEVDWDWRAEKLGWKRHFVPVESIVHLQKTKGYGFTSDSNFFIKRNTATWYAKAHKWLSMLIWMIATLVIAMARCIIAPLQGRSFVEYARFFGRLVAGYAGVLTFVIRSGFTCPTR